MQRSHSCHGGMDAPCKRTVIDNFAHGALGNCTTFGQFYSTSTSNDIALFVCVHYTAVLVVGSAISIIYSTVAHQEERKCN